MSDNKNFDRIEAYLFGQMTAEEAQSMEQDAAQDTALADQIRQHSLEHRAMELLVQDDLRAQLSAWKAAQQAGQPHLTAPVLHATPSRRLWYRLAAAAAVTLVMGFFARSLFLGNSAESLALQSLDESGISARSGGPDSALDEVYLAMERHDYHTALQQLDALPPSDQTRHTVSLLQGECQLRLQDYAAAATVLKQLVASSPADDLREKAEWLLLVAYVAGGQNAAEANSLFAKIMNDAGHPYADDARRLKSQMRQ